MTTIARSLYENGIYHIYNRGHNQMTLYRDINDFIFYLKCIKYCRKTISFQIYSICLMTNHYHILLKDKEKNLPLIMDTINSIYARRFNEKYNHKGSIFDGPFESNPILTDYAFTRVYRYIIRNPVAAGMTDSIYDYPWVTPTKEKDIFNCINFEYVDQIFRNVCKIGYEEYLKSDVDDLWVDDIEIYRMEEELAEQVFNKILYKFTTQTKFEKNKIDKDTQKKIIRLAWFRGITLGQLSKFCGYSVSAIHKLKD